MSETRTWKCPDCGHTEEIDYDWLASHGGPVCNDCDLDMVLQPATPAAADRGIVAERLVEKAEAAGLTAEDLDETVHEFAASVAADVNNGGLEDQILYMIDGPGPRYAEEQIDKLIQERKPEEQ